MTTYYVDSVSGSNTSPYDTWAKAATSFWSVGSPAATLGNGDIVYVASNHVDAATGAVTLTLPQTIGQTATIISATSGTTTYAAGAQIRSTSGAMIFNGSASFYGCTFNTSALLTIRARENAPQFYYGCTFKAADNTALTHDVPHANIRFVGCTFDYSADTANRTEACFKFRGRVEMFGGTYVKAGSFNRTGVVFESYLDGGIFTISSCDFSVIASNNDLYIGTTGNDDVTFSQCLFPASWALTSGNLTQVKGKVRVINCATATGDDPRILYTRDAFGAITYSTSIYRTGGAEIEDAGVVSWGVVTTAYATEAFPFKSEWMYGVVSATGSKTFTVYVANNTEDLHEDDIWLELEYLGTSNSAAATFDHDGRTGGFGAASTTVQTDDTGSTWNGTTLTYMQSLAKTVTVNETGQYRARVCVGKPSLTAYLDPLVTVS